jgi:hypothetical protein
MCEGNARLLLPGWRAVNLAKLEWLNSCVNFFPLIIQPPRQSVNFLHDLSKQNLRGVFEIRQHIEIN